MKVLVCGGRSYLDKKRVFGVLNELNSARTIELLIDGDCGDIDRLSGYPYGADYLGYRWAREQQIPSMRFPAHFPTMGKKAGPIRNSWMIKFGQPDLVVAFPGGKGTADMVAKAKRKGIKVVQL